MQFNGRVAVITGAESDVGQGFARALAAQGVSLMLIAQPGHQVRDLAEELERAHGIRCFPASADVADRAAVDRLVMHAEQHVGTIDMVVNTVPGCLTDALVPTMRQRGHGYVVDVSAVGRQTSVRRNESADSSPTRDREAGAGLDQGHPLTFLGLPADGDR